jgi:predicted Zn finger-like uncharacterized protein
MRIVCPSCAVSYEVPDSKLKPGRTVRCARCGHGWVPLDVEAHVPASLDEPLPDNAFHRAFDTTTPTEEPEPAPMTASQDVALASPQLSAMDILSANRVQAERPGPPWGAWLVSIVLLCALGAAGVVWRDTVATTWPPSIRIYQALGLSLTPGVPAGATPAPVGGHAPAGAPAQQAPAKTH